MGGIKIKKKKGRQTDVTWFGIRLDYTLATVLFIFAILGVFWSMISVFYLFNGVITLLSYSSALSQVNVMGTVMNSYIMYLIVDLIILVICFYTIKKCKQTRK